MDDAAATKPARKPQIRPRVRDALALIVTRGLSISEAADSVGMAREALSRALKRPHVLAAKEDVSRAWRSSRTERALVTIADLSVDAASEDVRLKAARSWLELEGLMGANRRDAPAPVGVAVQIIVGSGRDRREVLISDKSTGVIEAQPWAAPTREPEDHDD